MFSNVDFPDPFSPTSAWISPGAAVDADLAKRLYRTERLGHAS